jgi:tetratricopeptide (TPR) repeat protein
VVLAVVQGERFAREMRTQSRVPDSEKFDLGVVLAQFEANAEAAEVFQELWQKTPGSYDVGFNLALVQYRAGELAAALRVVDELSSKTTRPRAELLNLRGWIYNNMRKLDLARKSLEMAIATEPNNPDHYLDLSRVLYDAGETDAGIQAVSEGLQHSHDRDRLQVQMGLLYQKSGNYAEAENCYRHAQQSNSANRSAYLALANLMSAARRRKEALELLAKAIESLPGDFLLHYMYGGELLDSEPDPSPELLERTDSILKRALELNPFYANTHYLLGKLCLKKGDYDAARSYLEKACAFNPSHIGAYTQLGIIARHQGKKERATELAQIVQSLNEQADRNRQEILSNAVQESLGTQTSIKVK